MSILYGTLIIFFILGLIVGSFLNVVILRHNTGLSLSGRSGCMSCSSSLKWWQLLPVISFFILRGKCHDCGSKISLQYPIVELSLGIIFALISVQGFDILHIILAMLISTLLLAIAVYDSHHTIIPNSYVYTFAGLAAIWNMQYLVNFAIAGAVLATPFALMWIISKGKWIGLGDAKLMLGIGVMLGLIGGFATLTIGSILGSIAGLSYIAWRKLCTLRLGYTKRTSKIRLEIPFGPFLIFGFFAVWLLHLDTMYLQLIL